LELCEAALIFSDSTSSIRGRKQKLVEVSLLELRQCAHRENGLFAQTHLDFDLDAHLVAGVGASGVRKETVIRKIE
jgi:hypothetical protein